MRPAWAPPGRATLRRALVATDVFATAVAWVLVLGRVNGQRAGALAHLAVLAGVTAASVVVIASQQLYLARVCRLRAIEVSRLARAALIVGVLVYLGGSRWGFEVSAARAAVGVVAMAGSLCLGRGVYAARLRRHRANGRHTRPVVVVGSPDEATGLTRLLDEHPHLGYNVVASVSRSDRVLATLEQHRSDTVLVATTGIASGDLNHLTRILLDRGVHVHLTSGLSGVDHRRLRAQPLAREPMFYIERPTVSPWQRAVKRTVDVVAGTVALVLVLPVLAAAAAAIKLEDGGPMIFKSQRVGRGGHLFTIYKLRTMIQGADRKLHLVAAQNQRSGPLFKAHDDPRVTRVGKLLRATSIDELPQLVNVLLGSMSLVGPRPALAHEVAEFDDELRDRERVRPGITGLWQIEGRDDPSFDAYKRLDLYYVENWSLELDFVILLMTAQAVIQQAIRERRRQWKARTETGQLIDLTGRAEATG